MADKPNFLNSVLQGLGLGKEPPKPPAKPPAKPTGQLAGRATAPLGKQTSKAEQAQDSKDRRFLISAYQTQPHLLAAFSDAQYMYKLVSEECDYLRLSIEEKEQEQKHLEEKARMGTLTPREQWRLKAVASELLVHQEDRSRIMPLLKKITNQTGPLKPLGPEEKAHQSSQRRYLIESYEKVPVLIPEFKDPQYMYRLFGEECDYAAECIREKEEALKELASKERPTPRDRSVMKTLEEEIRALQADLDRFQFLRKKAMEKPAPEENEENAESEEI